MNLASRAVAVAVVLALAWAGPFAPLAMAQQPPPQQPAQEQPAQQPAPPPAQPAAPPQMFQEDVKPAPPRRGFDVYDAGAVAFTVLGFGGKIALCAMGTAFGLIAFGGTLGARPDAATAIIHEGCGGKSPWIVRGSDIRPRPAVSKAFDWETHRFDWEK
jgi:hypothetical protein